MFGFEEVGFGFGDAEGGVGGRVAVEDVVYEAEDFGELGFGELVQAVGEDVFVLGFGGGEGCGGDVGAAVQLFRGELEGAGNAGQGVLVGVGDLVVDVVADGGTC